MTYIYLVTEDRFYEYFEFVSTSLADTLKKMMDTADGKSYLMLYINETEHIDFAFHRSVYNLMMDFVNSDLPREFIKELWPIMQPYIDEENRIKEEKQKQTELKIREKELSELKRLKAKYGKSN